MRSENGSIVIGTLVCLAISMGFCFHLEQLREVEYQRSRDAFRQRLIDSSRQLEAYSDLVLDQFASEAQQAAEFDDQADVLQIVYQEPIEGRRPKPDRRRRHDDELPAPDPLDNVEPQPIPPKPRPTPDPKFPDVRPLPQPDEKPDRKPDRKPDHKPHIHVPDIVPDVVPDVAKPGLLMRIGRFILEVLILVVIGLAVIVIGIGIVNFRSRRL